MRLDYLGTAHPPAPASRPECCDRYHRGQSTLPGCFVTRISAYQSVRRACPRLGPPGPLQFDEAVKRWLPSLNPPRTFSLAGRQWPWRPQFRITCREQLRSHCDTGYVPERVRAALVFGRGMSYRIGRMSCPPIRSKQWPSMGFNKSCWALRAKFSVPSIVVPSSCAFRCP